MTDPRDEAAPDAAAMPPRDAGVDAGADGAAAAPGSAVPPQPAEPEASNDLIGRAPEYGAYASPEEQARRRGQTDDGAVAGDASPRRDVAGTAGPSAPGSAAAAPAAAPQPQSQPQTPAPASSNAPLGPPPNVPGTPGTGGPAQPVWSWTTPPRQSRFVASGADRVLTLVLLALGIVNLITSAPNLLDFDAAMTTVYSMMDAGEFTATALANAMGVTALVVQVILFIVVAWWSLRRLRARRLTWWLPVAGAIVAWIAVTVIVVIVLAADPPTLAGASVTSI